MKHAATAKATMMAHHTLLTPALISNMITITKRRQLVSLSPSV
jgi:hypothetical protein